MASTRAQTLKTQPGSPLPLGPSFTAAGVNFAAFSRTAAGMTLCLFPPEPEAKEIRIHLTPHVHRTGDIWHIHVDDLPRDWTYGWRVDGPYDPVGRGHRCNWHKLLIDPYAKALVGRFVWDSPAFLGYRMDEGDASFSTEDSAPYVPKCALVEDAFDWEGDRPLRIPLKESIIYEVHVKGFTRHPSSGVLAPGTFRGFQEKIPYLKDLGVTAVELLPIFEFDPNENVKINPATGRKLVNYWGYSSVSFFAPKAAYAASAQPDGAAREFKELVKALHRAGIEVILDVVYNHTAEGDHMGPTFCFRGFDNAIYYMLDDNRRYYRNYSGCGNTFNCNHPLVRDFVLDSLRFWVVEMHVDGFRFDLASILGRAQDGSVLSNPPLLERIAHDPILADCKIIPEAWDAAGLYQVGPFPAARRWAEWNARYRDDVRRFVRGDDGLAPAIATRIGGSSDLYQHDGRSPYHSINFVTSHDGFTLWDLAAYNQKHNEDNGEGNRDGMNDNFSWNCGAEGETEDPLVVTLRQRQVKNFWTVLMTSQGVPMVLGGDEFGRSQRGNNNAYCQDNETSWFDWSFLERRSEIYRFAREAIRFRRRHPALMRHSFLVGRADGTSAEGDITWHGLRVGEPDWSPGSRLLAFMLLGAPHLTLAEEEDDDIYVCFNMSVEAATCELPTPRPGRAWRRAIDTSLPSPDDIAPQGAEQLLTTQDRYRVHARSSVVLVAR